MLRITSFITALGFALLFANTANAASLYFVPETGAFDINKEISVDLKINSEGTGVNATQATIRFPKNIIEVKSVNKDSSAFNFWLEEPSFSNTDGVITFIGGTPYGVSGASIQVLNITFVTKSIGTALVTFADAAVTASDGSGTNVLSTTKEAAFTVAPTTVSAPITAAPVTVAPTILPPIQITRAPAPAVGLPKTPVVTVTSYPVPTNWYNHTNVFTASWELPLDITNIATAINKQPGYIPVKTEGLFDSKMFEAPSDGVWYLHVQFKNEIGWGNTAHYRIAVDTKTPLPFEISSLESTETDNPTPAFNFQTTDALSGLMEYRLKIDTKNWEIIPAKDFSGSHKLSHQVPAKHHLTILAVDNAGNSIENSIDFTTLPLPAPTFTFTTARIFSEEASGLTFKGTSLPSTEILFLIKSRGALVTENIVPVDVNGNWEFTFSEPLRNGRYIASIQDRDARGALSLEIFAPEIQVTGKYTSVILITMIVLLVALFGGFWFYERRHERIALRIDVAESDASKVFKMIENDIEKLDRARATETPADDEFAIQKMKENVNKMGGYIKEEIKQAKK